ncbi:MAG TPA: translation initiation factor 2 [Candidatus Blautia faecigallinarum]|uniref:Translation initiation factor 2 n=1 Tax=Candidatus Blautia faecigallinarum TaxID=2838488 RepID=A0A9D2IST9_9FIRM|nr:translation initiation factor 2 [Candidatus Blautia faecigallinarum]
MKGRHHIIIESPRLKYEFEIKRNITVIRGESATGKTTMVDLLRDFSRGGNQNLIRVVSDYPCVVYEGGEKNWKDFLALIHDAIVFIDEENYFIGTKDFAEYILHTSNYYVLISREPLKNLPYSICEIYGIRTTGKYHFPEQIYHEFYPLYSPEEKENKVEGENTVFVCEDSKAGFQFLQRCSLNNCECISAAGNSNIYDKIQNLDKEKLLIIVADGAAFGAYMEKLMAYIHYRKNVFLYLPESFEWIILKADILKIPHIKQILAEPYNYIESEQYFSWEQYFTDLLTDYTKKDKTVRYHKEKLSEYYLEGYNREKIQKVYPEEIQKIWKDIQVLKNKKEPV